ncbi:hypothetical protein RSOLAG1IB_06205 [Rhizoctonia solani AG-1 IB]|uniref:Uncharacterized protein n=1 Tax=Thanatephorus cucumeris (strain AG1-IB / isolate 7/3/14) TaxID=1108050 RepID=A0A0B7F8L6_THACB|nr:hypothetical protein RSOLAG1IB_06205 [Rhizoctonia solani AG-1 IB]
MYGRISMRVRFLVRSLAISPLKPNPRRNSLINFNSHLIYGCANLPQLQRLGLGEGLAVAIKLPHKSFHLPPMGDSALKLPSTT